MEAFKSANKDRYAKNNLMMIDPNIASRISLAAQDNHARFVMIMAFKTVY